jgi:lysophospholipase L1-like esterase
MYKWQNYLGFMLGANVTTHAKGGIGMLEMVDGDKTLKSDNADPNDFGVQRLLPLSTDDVADKDYIIVMGLYNNNWVYETNRGFLSDVYPVDSTYCGQFNYMVKRIKEELKHSQNVNCHIIIASPHIFGKYPYNNNDAYRYITLGMIDTIDSLCTRNNVDFCDLTKYAKIDSTNWDNYHLNGYITKDSPEYCIAKYPENKDQLHLNKYGHMVVASGIARWMQEKYVSKQSK